MADTDLGTRPLGWSGPARDTYLLAVARDVHDQGSFAANITKYNLTILFI